jgi:hypothetical protein
MGNRSSQKKLKPVLITISTLILLLGSSQARVGQHVPARNVYTVTTKAGFREDRQARVEPTRPDNRNFYSRVPQTVSGVRADYSQPSPTVRLGWAFCCCQSYSMCSRECWEYSC